jgi:hypothetical protein
VKKTLLLLAAALLVSAISMPAFADGNPYDPPHKLMSLPGTVLSDGNPYDPPHKLANLPGTVLSDGNPFDPPSKGGH